MPVVYSFSLVVGKQQPINGMGSIADLQSLLARFKLPGGKSPEWIVDHAKVEDRHAGRFSFTYNADGAEGWQLLWNRVDRSGEL